VQLGDPGNAELSARPPWAKDGKQLAGTMTKAQLFDKKIIASLTVLLSTYIGIVKAPTRLMSPT
jgi:hypothetical protein